MATRRSSAGDADFCCGGCRAGAEAICRGGLEDYYRLRTEMPPAATSQEDSDNRLLAPYPMGLGSRVKPQRA